MPRGKRAIGNTSVTISITEQFRDEIDAAAAAENRTRSNYIVTVLAKKLAQQKAMKELEAKAPAPFISTARAPHHETPSLNEEPVTRDAVAPKMPPPRITRARSALRKLPPANQPKD